MRKNYKLNLASSTLRLRHHHCHCGYGAVTATADTPSNQGIFKHENTVATVGPTVASPVYAAKFGAKRRASIDSRSGPERPHPQSTRCWRRAEQQTSLRRGLFPRRWRAPCRLEPAWRLRGFAAGATAACPPRQQQSALCFKLGPR